MELKINNVQSDCRVKHWCTALSPFRYRPPFNEDEDAGPRHLDEDYLRDRRISTTWRNTRRSVGRVSGLGTCIYLHPSSDGRDIDICAGARGTTQERSNMVPTHQGDQRMDAPVRLPLLYKTPACGRTVETSSRHDCTDLRTTAPGARATAT